ncbi:MAG: MATE family efflux transporter [Lachnospiraceae bacterium]
MKRDRTDLLLYEKNMYKSFVILALPVFGVNILMSLNDLIDTYFVGQMPNSVAAQAGMSISWPLINILMAFNIGLAVAGVAVISQFLGAGKKEEAQKYSGMLVLLSVGLGFVINLLLFLVTPFVIGWMGATGDTYTSAVTYVQVRSFEMVFSFLFAAFQSIRQSRGDTVTPVALSAMGIVVNVILNAVFIQGLGMGVFGAALATVISLAVRAPFCIYYLFIDKGESRLSLKDLKPDFTCIKKLSIIAMPSAGSQAFSSFGFLFLQVFVLSYGERVSAAFSLGNKVSNLLLMPVMALGSVLATFVGQNIGNQNKERAIHAYKVSRNLGLIISVVGSLLLFPLREMALGLLTNDPETLSIAMEFMIYVLLLQPLMSMFQSYISLFNGAGKTTYSFIMSTARLWILRLPFIMFCQHFTNIGRLGIWYAMVYSNFMIVLLGMFFYRKIDFSATISGGKVKARVKFL